MRKVFALGASETVLERKQHEYLQGRVTEARYVYAEMGDHTSEAALLMAERDLAVFEAEMEKRQNGRGNGNA